MGLCVLCCGRRIDLYVVVVSCLLVAGLAVVLVNVLKNLSLGCLPSVLSV